MEPTPSPPQDAKPLLHGSCHCQSIKLTTTTPPLAISFCHCVPCRKISGNPFASFGLFHNDAVVLHFPPGKTEAESVALKEYSPLARRAFCRACNAPLFMRYHCRPDGVHLCMGLLDDEQRPGAAEDMRRLWLWRAIPKEHIFLDSAKMSTLWGLGGLPLDDGVGDEHRHDGFDASFVRRREEWERRGRPRVGGS